MLVPNNIYQEIDDIIERSYTGFIQELVGSQFLTQDQRTMAEALGLLTEGKSLLELLYLLVKQRSEERYQTRRELQELLDDIFQTGVFDRLPETHQATIDNALQSMNDIVTKVKNEVKEKVKKEIVRINKLETDRKVISFDNLEQDSKNKNTALLLAAVGAAVLAAHKTFERDFTSELTDFVNRAASDVAKDSPEGKDTIVYKRVVNDKHLCNYCFKSYMNPDGTPKMYKLKELQANGSNDGKPKSQWKPVVGTHHPRCRCQLVISGPKSEIST